MGKIRGYAGGQARRVVRPWIVDGVAAHLRPARSGPAGLVGHGLVCSAWVCLLVGRHGRLWPLGQAARHLLRHRQRRRRSGRRNRLHSRDSRHRELRDVRHFVRRAARGAVRTAASPSSGAARARRVRVDGRRRPHARATQEEAARVSGQQAASNRPCLRLFDLRARPPRYRRKACRRRVRRRDPRARSFRSWTRP